MDMNERVAARRAELEREERQAKAAVGEAAKVQREVNAAAEEKDRLRQAAATEGIFDGLFGDANAAGVKIKREGDDVVLQEERKPAKIDRAGMRQGKVNRMINRAARERWTPEESLLIFGIGGMAVATLFVVPILGAAMFGFSVWRLTVTNKKYRAELRRDYPALFEPRDAV